jgi:hypothetical protein
MVNEIIGWFDSEEKTHANGVPWSELFELLLTFSGAVAISEQLMAKPGRVKAVILKKFGELDACDFPILQMRELAFKHGLEFIYRDRQGRSMLEFAEYYTKVVTCRQG